MPIKNDNLNDYFKKKNTPLKEQFSKEFIILIICIAALFFSIFDFKKTDKLYVDKEKIAPTKVIEPAYKDIIIPLPKNGELRVFTEKNFLAPLNIESSKQHNFLVKFYDNNKNIIFSLFVRKNSSVKTKAPLGEYIVKYATGKEWYGYDKLFGYSTSYYKINKKINFYQTGSVLNGHTLKLLDVINGNLTKSTISKSSF